jgi:5-methylcytosine-specific restriction endonuclease McrA
MNFQDSQHRRIRDNRHLPDGDPCSCRRPPQAHRVFHRPVGDPCSKCCLPGSCHIVRPSGSSSQVRQALRDRDGFMCKLCLATFDDPSPTWPHPKSVTVDHVVPLWLGGTHDLENLQLAHNACNLKKQNDSPSPQQKQSSKC